MGLDLLLLPTSNGPEYRAQLPEERTSSRDGCGSSVAVTSGCKDVKQNASVRDQNLLATAQ